jgi:hypothetical protein
LNVQEKQIQELQAHFAALSKRIGGVENDFKEVVKAKGIKGDVGPRGPAGDIAAAVDNAKKAATEVAVNSVRAEIQYPFEQKVAELRKEFSDLNSRIDETIHNTVANHVVKTLQEYSVLNENMEPISESWLKFYLIKFGVLKS